MTESGSDFFECFFHPIIVTGEGSAKCLIMSEFVASLIKDPISYVLLIEGRDERYVKRLTTTKKTAIKR